MIVPDSAHSPDLVPSDFHLFWMHTEALRERRSLCGDAENMHHKGR